MSERKTGCSRHSALNGGSNANLATIDKPTNAPPITSANIARRVDGLRVVPYNIPEGCCGADYPECNPLVPLWQHAEGAKVPAAKSVPVRIVRQVSH